MVGRKFPIPLFVSSLAVSLLQVSAGLVPSPVTLHPSEVQVTVGENVTLRCPVPFRTDFVSWTKSGDNSRQLEYSPRHRLSTRGGALRIFGSVPSDSGTYVCRAAGGHGQQDAQVNLTVIDNSDHSRELQNNDYPEYSDTGKPHFRSGKRLSTLIQRRVGDTVTFPCDAKGRAHMDVQWLKDNRKMQVGIRDKKRSKWTLTISNLQERDSGLYTCTVSNQLGTITANFTLQVIDTNTDQPELLGSDPVNTTVTYGSTATMLCRSRSKTMQKIQWLKKVQESEVQSGEDKPFQIDNEYFRILKNHQEVPVGSPDEGIYLSKLQLGPISEEGKYICVAHNTQGRYTYRAAYVLIFSDAQELHASTAHNFALTSILVAISVLIVFLLLRFSLHLYRRCCFTSRKTTLPSPEYRVRLPEVQGPQLPEIRTKRPHSTPTRHKHFHHHQHRHQHHLLRDHDGCSKFPRIAIV